jgi:acyl-coenzyme A synthetase/AMP-(fatty) acid ligase
MAVRSAAVWRAVPDILLDCAERRPDVTLIVEPGAQPVSAADLLDQSLRGAQTLHALGVTRGTYVGIDTATLPWREVAAAYLSVVWLGAVAVMSLGERTERIALRKVNMSTLVTAPGRTPPAGIRLVTPARLRAGEWYAGPVLAGPDDQLDLVFTSGTTGEPKLVTSTHAQWTKSVRPELMRSGARRVVAHCGIPVALSGGLHGIMINHIARGVTSVCTTSTGQLLAACREHTVDELHLPPHGARALMRLMSPDEPWTVSVRMIRIVGGPLPSVVAEELAARFPRGRTVSFYGLTEGGSALLMRAVDRTGQDSIGRPAPGTQVRVVGPDGADLPSGEVGELLVRSAGTNPPSQADGWVPSGDLGYLDATNEVHLVGRAAELVFLRGGRVSPEAVEEILARRIPRGVDFAVAGVPTLGAWDRIAVFLGGPHDDPQIELARHGLAEMRGPFRPQLVRVVPSIPRGPLGKPLRRQLTDELARG